MKDQIVYRAYSNDENVLQDKSYDNAYKIHGLEFLHDQGHFTAGCDKECTEGKNQEYDDAQIGRISDLCEDRDCKIDYGCGHHQDMPGLCFWIFIIKRKIRVCGFVFDLF